MIKFAFAALALVLTVPAVASPVTDIGKTITFHDPYPERVAAGCTLIADAERVDTYRQKDQYYQLESFLNWINEGSIKNGEDRICIVLNRTSANGWKVVKKLNDRRKPYVWVCLEADPPVDFSPVNSKSNPGDGCFWVRLFDNK
jgi:hypothetical protein